MKFRIVRCAESNCRYFVQKQVLGIFWRTIFGSPQYSLLSLEECEHWIRMEIQRNQIAKENPKAVVVKTIEF